MTFLLNTSLIIAILAISSHFSLSSALSPHLSVVSVTVPLCLSGSQSRWQRNRKPWPIQPRSVQSSALCEWLSISRPPLLLCRLESWSGAFFPISECQRDSSSSKSYLFLYVCKSLHPTHGNRCQGPRKLQGPACASQLRYSFRGGKWCMDKHQLLGNREVMRAVHLSHASAHVGTWRSMWDA